METSQLKVQGCCLSCGHETLFLGDGGYITCGDIECPEPLATSNFVDGGQRFRSLVRVTEVKERLVIQSRTGNRPLYETVTAENQLGTHMGVVGVDEIQLCMHGQNVRVGDKFNVTVQVHVDKE